MAIYRKYLEGIDLMHPSPLRYPGGKNKLASFIEDAVILNGIEGGTYIEPFAGGASVALFLLFREYVNEIIINDIDKSIFAFWHSVLNETEKLCEMIADTPITITEWEKQRIIQQEKNEVEYLSLGFSTFFLNRTNRSGIIGAGVIGGKAQSGVWKMDVRFNKTDLIKRIEKIALYRNRILIHNEDALEFVNAIRPALGEKTLIYFDPPYYCKGAGLYDNHYTHNDHMRLARFIQGLNYKWVLTYDYTPEIINMYPNVDKKLLALSYTAADKVRGCEMIAFSKDFLIPEKEYSSVTIT